MWWCVSAAVQLELENGMAEPLDVGKQPYSDGNLGRGSPSGTPQSVCINAIKSNRSVSFSWMTVTWTRLTWPPLLRGREGPQARRVCQGAHTQTVR